MTDNNLEAILRGEQTQEAEQVEQDQQEEVANQEDSTSAEPATNEPQRADDTKGETTEPPSDKDNAQESWTKKAVLDERRKRQELELKLAEYENKARTGDQPQQEEIPDVFEDPEAALRYFEKKTNQAILNERVNMSREMMKTFKEDYEEMEQVFVDMANENPSLRDQMFRSSSPAKFAYETAKKHSEIQQLTTPEGLTAYKEQLRKELLAEMQAANQQPKPKSSKAQHAALQVPDIVNATSASSGNQNEIPTLEQIFGR